MDVLEVSQAAFYMYWPLVQQRNLASCMQVCNIVLFLWRKLAGIWWANGLIYALIPHQAIYWYWNNLTFGEVGFFFIYLLSTTKYGVLNCSKTTSEETPAGTLPSPNTALKPPCCWDCASFASSRNDWDFMMARSLITHCLRMVKLCIWAALNTCTLAK